MRKDRSRQVPLVTSALLGGIALWVIGHFGAAAMPVCMIHRVTGYHCPGCGTTRATVALLDGRFREAFGFNPLMMVLLPLGGLWVVWFSLRPADRRYRGEKRVGVAVLLLVLLYGVVRNIPRWPFTLLAPHGQEARNGKKS